MYIRSDKTTWQDKRIKAMNRVIEKYNSSTELFIEEYNRVCEKSNNSSIGQAVNGESKRY